MRIAQIAPLTESVPPKLYGGTERVVSYITEALVDLGHDVTLFASGDSITRAKLDAVWPRALRLDSSIRDRIAPHMLLMETVARRARDFDVLHFHMDYYSFSVFKRQDTPFVTTLHGRLDLPEQQPVFDTFDTAPVISISNAQRHPMPQAKWLTTVYHGLPETLYTPQPGEQSYLAFLGRISPEKRGRHGDPDRAALRDAHPHRGEDRRGGRRVFRARDQAALRAAARRIHRRDRRSREGRVPVGRACAAVSDRLARAVRPRDDRGDGVRHARHRVQSRRVPEVIDEGVSGFIVEDEIGAAAAVNRLHMLSRERVRARFEERFTSRRMAQQYVDVYQSLIRAQKRSRFKVIDSAS